MVQNSSGAKACWCQPKPTATAETKPLEMESSEFDAFRNVHSGPTHSLRSYRIGGAMFSFNLKLFTAFPGKNRTYKKGPEGAADSAGPGGYRGNPFTMAAFFIILSGGFGQSSGVGKRTSSRRFKRSVPFSDCFID
ncbi:hypothetical protein ZHAS_00021969 [Anopheles sinensis]|uniref:Uncharacterized protein n=1 Tax=Anopheles sinensis TaxID=74873 RepID=A0A084WTB9_ANOSI|nr:hypothetical protein ZHAS_00021969 [Anopheles sinensis]